MDGTGRSLTARTNALVDDKRMGVRANVIASGGGLWNRRFVGGASVSRRRTGVIARKVAEYFGRPIKTVRRSAALH